MKVSLSGDQIAPSINQSNLPVVLKDTPRTVRFTPSPPFKYQGDQRRTRHVQSERPVRARGWLNELEAAADELGLEEQARSRAGDLFLSNVPEEERSKRATMAACLYVGRWSAGNSGPRPASRTRRTSRG